MDCASYYGHIMSSVYGVQKDSRVTFGAKASAIEMLISVDLEKFGSGVEGGARNHCAVSLSTVQSQGRFSYNSGLTSQTGPPV